jgi:hypothetical protein
MNKTIVEQCANYEHYKIRFKQVIEGELKNKNIVSTNVYDDSLNF